MQPATDLSLLLKPDWRIVGCGCGCSDAKPCRSMRRLRASMEAECARIDREAALTSGDRAWIDQNQALATER